MQFKPLALACLLTLLPAAQAVGNAIVINNCPFDAFLNSVGSQIEDEEHLPANVGRYSEPFRRDPVSGGIALKVTRIQGGLPQGAPHTVFAYNLDGGKIWYDLSNVFGDPFAPNPLVLAPSDATCNSIVWPEGRPTAGTHTENCQENSDVTLTLCAELPPTTNRTPGAHKSA
ncbi:hypothetical protein FQN55_004256 [Onygenales sp. PD_40]|nr:hypothetical protein FQN55_004256 [Onygenales sp. PD_40]